MYKWLIYVICSSVSEADSSSLKVKMDYFFYRSILSSSSSSSSPVVSVIVYAFSQVIEAV